MQNVVTGGAMAINRALATLAGQCTAPQQTVMHDWWLAAVAARFGKIVYIDEPLSDYRQHGDNCVGAKDVRSLQYAGRMAARTRAVAERLRSKKMQAGVFYKTYADWLNEEDAAFLKAFCQARSGPAFYWRNRKLIHGFSAWRA